MKKFALVSTLLISISAVNPAFACVYQHTKDHDDEAFKKCIYACMITYDDPSLCELGQAPQH